MHLRQLSRALTGACALFSLGAKSKFVEQQYEYRSVQIPVSQFYDNTATEDFDGNKAGYAIELLPTGELASENIRFALPKWGNGRPDNFVSHKQKISVNAGHVREFHILYAGDWIDGENGAEFEFEFQNGGDKLFSNWWDLHWLNNGAIQTPYHNTPDGRNYNITQVHHWFSTVSSVSPLKAIRLVPAYAPDSHSGGPSPAISVKNVRLTTLKTDEGNSIVEVTLANLRALATSDYYAFASENASTSTVHRHRSPRLPHPDGNRQVVLGHKHRDHARDHEHYSSMVLTGPHQVIIRPIDGQIGLRTVTPGKVFRLMPGDDARVDVIATALGLPASMYRWITFRENSIEVEVILLSLETNSPTTRATGWELDLGNVDTLKRNGNFWKPTVASLSRHETPRWWNNAKFGILPQGYYEEWYNWWLHNPAQPSNELWNHHRDTYGESKLYDDFIPEFTGAKFNASRWINLFATAGAKYFVLVTKHHDGFALFDTHNSTSKEQPDMHKGTYYSLPEWFNPDAGPYGFGDWPGHLATGAYNHSLIEPYTGRLEGKDYLRDIQQEHMRILTQEYGSEIMWCDIGGPNRTLEFAAEWYNQATKAGKQVTMNNRCGVVPDFDTPEYARFSSIQTHSWETSEGIDPYSYGYNRQTKDEEYRSAETIIQSLVDIVSKNGNYLLNLGPTGEGEIIPAMVERLVEVGEWLGHSGECVFNTTYSFLGAESNSIRFTTTPKSFCIISLSEPEGDRLVVERPVPILPGDTITFLGDKSEKPVPWTYRDGRLTIFTTKSINTVKSAWAFKITYGDASARSFIRAKQDLNREKIVGEQRLLDLSKDQLEEILLHITSLHASSPLFPWSSRVYHNLTELRLSYSSVQHSNEISESNFVGILRSSPLLRRLEFAFFVVDVLPAATPVRPIVLEHMEELKVTIRKSMPSGVFDVGCLLRWIAPGSNPLQVVIDQRHNKWSVAIQENSVFRDKLVVDFFSRSNVTQVIATFEHHLSVLADLIDIAPNIRAIILEQFGFQVVPEAHSIPQSHICLDSLYLLRSGVDIPKLMNAIRVCKIRKIFFWGCFISQSPIVLSSDNDAISRALENSSLSYRPTIEYLPNHPLHPTGHPFQFHP
ncbi:alpha-L-fucosidase [Rhizoctonia solani]|uniref:alpha-L-fucosidase n=1 Tax=Rhizoctonia solani TaxID=456999 RepID=A0A8H8T261_9AGAM|nr:alpha-L-fucosidase [Rhizoctonia solani]QRW26549.1 alpha-L-fucosidase [Rhizoctonia solani]